METKTLAAAAIEAVKKFVSQSQKALEDRISAAEATVKEAATSTKSKLSEMEQRISSSPPPKDGKDGKSVAIEDVKPLLESMVKAIEIPAPIKGDKGDSVSLAEIQPIIEQAIKGALELIPHPTDGKDGQDAVLDMVALEKIINTAVLEAVAKINIPKPRDGEDGLDALDIEILPIINEDKTYPRGVYATHKGGLWKSHCTTDGMKGWECIVDGMQEVKIEYDGQRSFGIIFRRSSGALETKDFTIPTLIYKEVYREGDKYERGDCVTYGGSIYTALANTDEKPGSGSKDWRLAVKAGRNATDRVKLPEPIKGVA